MRALTPGVLAVALLASALPASCASPTSPPAATPDTTSPVQSSRSGIVDPERIRRIRPELPDGYEIADVGGYASSPVAFWGLGRGWSAQPPQCAQLVDPVPDGPAHGVSGSGPGGIIYVVIVSGAATGPVGVSGTAGLDPVLLGECGRWAMEYGRSTAEVNLVAAPVIDGATTLGVSSAIRNVVESGTQTDSRADTFMAYLGEYIVFVTLVTDPGSVESPLPPHYASDLLVKTVDTVRG